MSTLLKRRLEKIEAAVMPKPLVDVVILIDPGADASAEDRGAFEHGIESAIANRQRVVVVLRKKTDAQIERNGVEYADTETEAQMIALAIQPSAQGRADKLADVLADLSGNVLGVSNHKEPQR